MSMLSDFIATNREEILMRTRKRVAIRLAPRPTESELEHGIPVFLDQLTQVLTDEAARDASSDPEVGRVAAGHGGDRMRLGLTVDQLVHDYGDVCQAVTELALDLGAAIPTEDFRTLNKCLDFAIARAVTEFERQRERHQFERENERTGYMAHELRNLLSTAKLTFHVLKQGTLGIGSSTGALLERTLNSLSEMVDRSVARVRATSGVPYAERIRVFDLMEELQVAATIEASSTGHKLVVEPTLGTLEIESDRMLVGAAVTNLLRNAFKFSRPGGTITLRARTIGDETLVIEVEDECGGLPAGKEEEIFKPFVQQGSDRSGLGLGLSISRESVEAGGGTLAVRNLPGRGCVFSVELPLALPVLAQDSGLVPHAPDVRGAPRTLPEPDGDSDGSGSLPH